MVPPARCDGGSWTGGGRRGEGTTMDIGRTVRVFRAEPLVAPGTGPPGPEPVARTGVVPDEREPRPAERIEAVPVAAGAVPPAG
ncbi:hypothetical protein PP1_028625 [Pseudonocardia sp. P1]